MQSIPSPGATLRVALLAFLLLWPCVGARAQNNILIYGNSIIFSPTVPFFRDLITQAGLPMPTIEEAIGPDRTTSDFVGQIGLITSSLPAGQTWRAMIVEGGTIENNPTIGNPAFHANMLTLANALFAHSPNGLFVGHETGADHPNSLNYPTLAPNPATWLNWSHTGYVTAAHAITASHPGNPPARLALQGTCVAATAGYPQFLYGVGLHELSVRGKLLTAMLWFSEIYGARIARIPLNFAVPTPLVTRLLANGITAAHWSQLAGFADYVQPPALRPFPGSNGDFQLVSSSSSAILNLLPAKTVFANASVMMQMVSPLGTTQNSPAVIFGSFQPTGLYPVLTPPAFWLSGNAVRLQQVPNLSGGSTFLTIPPAMLGNTLWIQAISQGPAGGAITYSDAQLIEVR